MPMSAGIHRREFLKLAGLLPLSLAAPRWTRALAGASGRPNVIVVVFDAFSAYNISLYGYQRDTTPNIAGLAKRAIVYHNHFAGSNFTTSGTATLLTGTLPWTNRALQHGGKVAEKLVSHNLFEVIDDYYRASYTHNGWVYTLLRQFQPSINQLVPVQKLFLGHYNDFIESLFRNDNDIASVSWTREMTLGDGYAYSLLLSHLYKALEDGNTAGLQQFYPRGVPEFILEQGIDWIGNMLTTIPQPFLGYFHFLPPHDPYDTPLEFYNSLKGDGYQALKKPVDILADPKNISSDDELRRLRREYDEYIRYVDSQFGRFYHELEAAGLLDNTWVILTSDHGELHERGMWGHANDTLYQPLVRIPLLIFEPGRETGMDIQTLTSAVDVLPTVAHLTGHAVPDWAEGTILPPFAANPPDPNRSLYAVKAVSNDPKAPLTSASTMLVRGEYKLLYYFGNPALAGKALVKLYDIKADPQELVDLYSTHKDIAAELLSDLKLKLDQVNKPYR